MYARLSFRVPPASHWAILLSKDHLHMFAFTTVLLPKQVADQDCTYEQPVKHLPCTRPDV
jgi:hypothetical protein